MDVKKGSWFASSAVPALSERGRSKSDWILVRIVRDPAEV
jgi:hypothetical protein